MSQPLVLTAAIFGCDDIITFKRTWPRFLIVFGIITVVMIVLVAVVFRLATGTWQLLPRDSAEGNTTPTPSHGGDSPRQDGIQSFQRRQTLATKAMNCFQRSGINQFLAWVWRISRDDIPDRNELPDWRPVNGVQATAREVETTPDQRSS